MSIKVVDLANKKKNENIQRRILQRISSDPQKRAVFHSLSESDTLQLSDKTEFPSLSESVGKASSNISSTAGSLKYSDKLKSSFSSRNQIPGDAVLKNNVVVTDNYDQNINKIGAQKFQHFNNKSKLVDNSKQNVPKQAFDNSVNKSVSVNYEKRPLDKRELPKQKGIVKSKTNVHAIAVKSSPFDSVNANLSTKSNNPIQFTKPISTGTSELKEDNNGTQDTSVSKKKKKRKSKVKRQVALQSGKITFLTPEVHSKILNQANSCTTQNLSKNSVIGNIDDEEEYPGLGKEVLQVNQKENFLKKIVSSDCQLKAADKLTESSAVETAVSKDTLKDCPMTAVSEKTVIEKKAKIHAHNPITVSFYDMLLEKNCKKKNEVKEMENEAEIPNIIGLSKLKNKKNASYPHNLLDSSSPAVKRGKEREKPKPKKPSQLKKIILLDRKARQEHLLQLKNNSKEENSTDEKKPSEEESYEAAEEKRNPSENNFENDIRMLYFEDDSETLFEVSEFLDGSEDELSEMINLHISEHIGDYDIESNLSANINEEEKKVSEKFVSPISSDKKDNIMLSKISKHSDTISDVPLNVPRSPDSLLISLTKNTQPDNSDKEKAVKILLHTRNFREYCNHLISKDIDDAAFALLDDLARFQDRLHQKDPVKARMKRRLIYGVKEVKKHIKLRKLKCIIIAVDIENVETQGGLNDLLNEIKISAVDHHIPYIFALSRKTLGKVCRKPVPVSCCGVFNYEGSEANFKKMIELQSQSKADYSEIFNKLLININDEETAALIKAKKEAPETLQTVRANILSNFFQLPDSIKNGEESVDLKSSEQISDLIDTAM